MQLWKQVGVSLAVVGAGACLWAFMSPDGKNMLAKVGLASAEQPAAQSAGAAGAGRGQGGSRGNSATLVSIAPVKTGTVNDRLNAIGNGEAIQSVVVTPQASG